MKKKRGREDESYNISEVMSKEVKIKWGEHIRFTVLYNLLWILNHSKAVWITVTYLAF